MRYYDKSDREGLKNNWRAGDLHNLIETANRDINLIEEYRDAAIEHLTTVEETPFAGCVEFRKERNYAVNKVEWCVNYRIWPDIPDGEKFAFIPDCQIDAYRMVGNASKAEMIDTAAALAVRYGVPIRFINYKPTKAEIAMFEEMYIEGWECHERG